MPPRAGIRRAYRLPTAARIGAQRALRLVTRVCIARRAAIPGHGRGYRLTARTRHMTPGRIRFPTRRRGLTRVRTAARRRLTRRQTRVHIASLLQSRWLPTMVRMPPRRRWWIRFHIGRRSHRLPTRQPCCRHRPRHTNRRSKSARRSCNPTTGVALGRLTSCPKRPVRWVGRINRSL
jgi:hypothetical protein